MNIFERLKTNPHLSGFVSDIIYVVVVVSSVLLVSQLLLGLWTPMVVVESGSMVPNMNIGDIVIVQGSSRTQVITWGEAEKTGYTAFNKPGDVVLYRPYGKERMGLLDQVKALVGIPIPPYKATPIIHRALRYVNKGDPMWVGGPKASFDGYITKGDHNDVIDQSAGIILGLANTTYLAQEQKKGEIVEVGDGSIFMDKATGLIIYKADNNSYVGEGISYLTPVDKDWVIGVARVKIPLVGYVRLIPNYIVDGISKIFKSF
jgi:signal peptidase